MAPRNEKRRNDILEVSFRLFSTEPYNKVSFSGSAMKYMGEVLKLPINITENAGSQ